MNLKDIYHKMIYLYQYIIKFIPEFNIINNILNKIFYSNKLFIKLKCNK